MLTHPLRLLSQEVALHPAYIQGSEFTAFQLLFVSQMPIPPGALKITQWLIAFLKITACKVLCWGDWLLKLDTLAGVWVCVCVCLHPFPPQFAPFWSVVPSVIVMCPRDVITHSPDALFHLHPFANWSGGCPTLPGVLPQGAESLRILGGGVASL